MENKDAKNGKYITYYSDGMLQMKEYYVNGKRHGPRKWWRYDGQLAIRDNYVDGKQHGVEELWDEGDQSWNETFCINGRKISYREYRRYQINKETVVNKIVQIKDLMKLAMSFL